MRASQRLLAAITAAALLIPLSVASVSATPLTHYVDDDGLGTNSSCAGNSAIPSSIQDAVDVAGVGDTIMVCPGTYLGTITASTNGLKIQSVQAKMAIIEPAADHVPDTDLVTLQNASGMQLHGFKILVPTGGSCEYVNSLVTVSNAPNTVVAGNAIGITGTEGLGGCGYVTGISVSSASGGTKIMKNKITDFQAIGIYFIGSGTVTINHNKINYLQAAYPSSTGGDGIFANPTGGNALISYNTVRSLSTGGVSTPRLNTAINVAGGGLAHVTYNTGNNALTFIYVNGAPGGVVSHNNATLGIQDGLEFNQSTNVVVAHNNMAGTEFGVEVGSLASANSFHDNDWRGPTATDCSDVSSGGGTGNTANTWTSNRGTGTPPQICTP